MKDENIEPKLKKTTEETTEERENSGAEMSDAREMNEEMKKEYSGKGQEEKAARLNEKERERTEGSKLNVEEV